MRWVAMGLASLLLVACEESARPAASTSGIAAVDEVIAGVERRDVADLVARADQGVIPGVGWPASDEACGSTFVDDPSGVLEAFVAAGPTLYGAFEAPAITPGVETRPPAEWIRGAYWLVYSMPLEAGEFTNPGARLHVGEDGALVGLSVPCRGVPEWLAFWDQQRLQEIEVDRPAEDESRSR